MTKIANPKTDIARRLKIAAGHLNKIIAMVEEDQYCIHILQQTAAVKSAIKKTEDILLTNHLNSCLVKAIKHDQGETAVAELMEVLKRTS